MAVQTSLSLLLRTLPSTKEFLSKESFYEPIFHAKEFCRRADTNKMSKNAVIVGGAKSAYDVTYAYVQASEQVGLVIRSNGDGPV